MMWRMKDGTRVALNDMGDLHLTNCIRSTRQKITQLKLEGKNYLPNQKALEALLKERLKRDTYAFKEDFNYEWKEESKPTLTFMDALRGL